MMIDPILAQWLLGLLAALILGGVAFILRTLASQNTAMAGHSQALAVLVTRIDPAVEKTTRLEAAHGELKERVLRLELAQGLHANASVTVNA